MSETVGPVEPTLDYERARALYAQVLELEAPHDAREQATFRIGVCLEALERWHEAATAYGSYLALFDPVHDEYPADAEPGTHLYEARLRLGRCQLRSGRAAEARRTWEDLDQRLQRALSGRTDAQELFGVVPARAADIAGEAAYSVAETWPDATLAIAALERFLNAHPDHRLAARAAFAVAERLRSLGRHEDALASFEAFLGRPDPADVTEDGRAELETLRQRALFLRGQVELELRRFDTAKATWTEYVGRFSAGADWSAAQAGLVEAHYRAALDDKENRRWAAARERFESFLAEWPLDTRAPSIEFALGELHSLETQAVEPADVAGLERAVAVWRQGRSEVPALGDRVCGALVDRPEPVRASGSWSRPSPPSVNATSDATRTRPPRAWS